MVKKNAQFQEKSIKKTTGTDTNDKDNVDAIFKLKGIYPTDLNAKSFSKNYSSGAIQFEVQLKDGLKHGRYEQFYLSGKKKITGRFRKDLQVGAWRYYDENGNLLHKKRF